MLKKFKFTLEKFEIKELFLYGFLFLVAIGLLILILKPLFMFLLAFGVLAFVFVPEKKSMVSEGDIFGLTQVNVDYLTKIIIEKFFVNNVLNISYTKFLERFNISGDSSNRYSNNFKNSLEMDFFWFTLNLRPEDITDVGKELNQMSLIKFAQDIVNEQFILMNRQITFQVSSVILRENELIPGSYLFGIEYWSIDKVRLVTEDDLLRDGDF